MTSDSDDLDAAINQLRDSKPRPQPKLIVHYGGFLHRSFVAMAKRIPYGCVTDAMLEESRTWETLEIIEWEVGRG